MSSNGARAIASVVLATLASAQAPGSVAYVQASRAHLRDRPSSTAGLSGLLVVNTEVEVLGRSGSWCEVAARPGGQRGFVACHLLARRPLTLEEIDARLQSGALSSEEAVDWQSRAFWLSPSLSRWFEVGNALNHAYLSEAMRSREVERRRHLRPPKPEFEAMKAELGRGIVVAPPPKRPAEERETSGQVIEAMHRLSLPAVSPSHFREREEPFAIPRAPFKLEHARYVAAGLADRLSSHHQAPLRVRVAGPAYFMHVGGGADYDTVTGMWDVGRIEITFDKEVLIHGITPRGQASAVVVEAILYHFEPERCVRSGLGIKTRPVRGVGWGSAIVSWVGKPPVLGKVAVNTREVGGESPYDKLVVYDIDLDGDGAFDLSSWAGRYQPQVGAEGYWNAIFGNVAGKWVKLAHDADDDCT